MENEDRYSEMQSAAETDLETEATAEQRIEKYCADIKAAHVRSVEGVIQMGNIINEAKEELGDTYKTLEERLKDVIGYSSTVLSNLSTIAKKEALADSANWGRLPKGYNTLYQLAQVEDSKLADAIKNGVVNPGMTLAKAKALHTAVPITRNKGAASSDIPVILSLEDPDRQRELISKLDELLREYDGKIKDADKNGFLARCRRDSFVEEALAKLEATKDGLGRYTLEEMRLAESAADYFTSDEGKGKEATLPGRYKGMDFKPLIAEVGAINSSVTKKVLTAWVKERKIPNQLNDLARVQDVIYVWEQARLVAESVDEKGGLKRLRQLVNADNPSIAETAQKMLDRIYGFLPKGAAKGKKITEDNKLRAAA
ncbi:MAG: hypothetical protein KFB96_14700 [Thiocapsa sp.]|uniref:hypothetical protein n=1 Tax=Thiocapsa sp. TaxID=2024551 RepID=UPI001BCFF362|nr:hypothetical protein [Thiocapsa sp.]QVL46988.1 MAG: hypothetical protein KFB96_14700 [Thiocapsa sp.]